MSGEPRENGSAAESLFLKWLLRQEPSAELEFDALCCAHLDQAEALRELKARYERLLSLESQLGLRGSFAARLSELFGAELDPRIELEAESTEDFTARFVDRLAERTAGSTRYRLKGQVAEGGMGAILRVWDEDLRRHLAMKVVLGRRDAPSDATPQVDRRQLARFLEEAQVTGQLDHPGIVPVHELGLDAKGRAYFTMKLVKGRDLKAVYELVCSEAEGWSQVKALGVLLKVCEAMSYAHDKGVIHRDLKPANVMVGRYGEVYVMDWGLAKILGREDAKDIRLRPDSASSGQTVIQSDRREHASDTPDSPLYTMDGDVVGTPAYMPPEQANGNLEAMGPPSDVYAVGAMLYHLVAGHMPYVRLGEKVSNYAVWRWVKDGPPTSLAREAPLAPAELIAIADKAMARDPHARYGSMTALARDLSAYLEGRVVAAYETGAWAEGRKWVLRNPALAASLAATIVILVAGVVTSLAYARESNRLAVSETVAKEAAQRNGAESERLRNAAVDRERELRVRGLIQDLAAFDAVGQSIDYARRQSEPSSVWWPRWARLLIHGQDEDLERGMPWRPGLAEAERRLEQLRARAEPYSAADIQADRATHPRAAELERKRAELSWRRRMLGLEAWPDLAEVEAGLTPAQLAGDLARKALHLVNPNAPSYGEESYALILATRSASLATDDNRHLVLLTLAWALYFRGKLDEARETMERAAGNAPAEWHEAYEAFQEDLAAAIAPWRNGGPQAEFEDLAAEIAALDVLVAERRTWRFARSEDEWWHLQLVELIELLHRLEQRLEFVERSVATPDAQARWKEAIAAIDASERYGALKLTPQIGLLPIGADPQSGLWEFAHLQSGEPPERGADGNLVLTGETGLIFVLLPGGRFWMGAQATDPAGRNNDPDANNDFEAPVHEVELSPFFLSKYEMARGPWCRFADRVPQPWREDALMPIDSVSWNDCMTALARADAWITLSTEAQWEYACRAGTAWPWWTGPNEESLRDKENVKIDKLDDRLMLQLPIGHLAPNPYGLHDMLGNVSEYCLDGLRTYWLYSDTLVRDPVHSSAVENTHSLRGGNCWDEPASARSSYRLGVSPDVPFEWVGLRPARSIAP